MKIVPPIQNNSNIIRFAWSKRHIDKNTGKFTVSAFLLRKKDGKTEGYLSFGWLEFHNKTSFDENIRESIRMTLDRFYKSDDDEKELKNDKKYFAVIDLESLSSEIDKKDFDIEKIELITTNGSHTGMYYDPSNEDEISVILMRIANTNKNK